jgi:hypothetical protein
MYEKPTLKREAICPTLIHTAVHRYEIQKEAKNLKTNLFLDNNYS